MEIVAAKNCLKTVVEAIKTFSKLLYRDTFYKVCDFNLDEEATLRQSLDYTKLTECSGTYLNRGSWNAKAHTLRVKCAERER